MSQINVTTIRNRTGGPPSLDQGVVVGSAATFSSTVSIAGTLTYEDVTNIDSVGIITAQTGIKVLAGGINAVGVVTATSFSGSGANLTGISAGLTTDAYRNTSGGINAGDSFTSGSALDNTLIGYSAGATGSQNLTTGDGNTVVGHNAIVSAAGASNQTVIGQGADGQADNSVTLGNDAVTAVYMASDSGALVHTAGIQFPATQVANGGANVLDDYEEGNGTPTVSMSTSGTVTLGSSPTYCYTKVGNIIHFSFEFSTTGVSSPVGTLQVALPIASAASFYSAGSLRVYSETFDGSPFISIAPSASVCQLLTSKTGAGTQSITPTAGTRYYFGTVTYRA